MNRYDVILADPPWSFNNRKGEKSRTADSKYRVLSPQDLTAMRYWVRDRSHLRSVLFMWTTAATQPQAIQLMTDWGFEYKTVAFVWVKLTKRETRPPFVMQIRAPNQMLDNTTRSLHFGMGHYTRSQTEFVLLGARKPLPRVARNVEQVVLAPVGEHSAKPNEVHRRIERIYPHSSRLEMFARRQEPGWSAMGDQL